jgi:hypothetical protein
MYADSLFNDPVWQYMGQRWRATMEYYVGLDVSLKQTSICVVDQATARARAQGKAVIAPRSSSRVSRRKKAT